MPQSHRYKPAPLARPVEVRVADGRIEQRDSGGRVIAAVSPGDVSGVRWSQTYAHRILARRLDLTTPGGRLTLHQSLGAAAGAENPDLRGYVGALRAVIDLLASSRPELEVALSAPAAVRWAQFAGLLTVVGVLVLPLSILLDRRDAGELWWLTAVLGLLMLGGLTVAWIRRPWRAARRVALRELAESLDGPGR